MNEEAHQEIQPEEIEAELDELELPEPEELPQDVAQDAPELPEPDELPQDVEPNALELPEYSWYISCTKPADPSGGIHQSA
ncbi:hypothetical protein HDU81_011217, partial [Chytriomyces hyalinus]